MGLFGFGKKEEAPVIDVEALVKRAEKEVDILAGDLAKKVWNEVHNSLLYSELNSPDLIEKMSIEAKAKLKQVIAEAQAAYEADKATIEEDLVEPIAEALKKIAEKL
ncbi:MAG: hypothetical protein WCK37_00020 [Candidatus Falkowbacteria bacterium]